jgi:hypothetical protein
MDTAQTLLTSGAQTQQLQSVTSQVPWVVFGVVVVIIAIVFLKGKK